MIYSKILAMPKMAQLPNYGPMGHMVDLMTNMRRCDMQQSMDNNILE